MSLDFLPCDLIFNILDYTWCEYDLKLVKALNKRFFKIMREYGIEREINVYNDSDMKKFINRYIKNKKSLRYLNMCRIENPTIWIPCEWPQIVEFIGCDLSSFISPPVLSKTKELVIKTYYSQKPNLEPLTIDFKKLPYLESLKIRCFNFDYKCLENCKNLKKFHLDLISYQGTKRKRKILEKELFSYLNPTCLISKYW